MNSLRRRTRSEIQLDEDLGANRPRFSWLVYTAMVLLSIPFLFPLYWLITGSFKSPATVIDIPPAWWPPHWVIANFHVLFNSGTVDIPRYAWNTLLICAAWVIGGTAVSALVAYGFARIDFPGRQFLFGTVIIVLILPYWTTIAPQYLLFKSLGWLNTLAPLTAPALTGIPFSIFLLREFMKGIPQELSDASRVDGANEFQIFWQVILPQLRPVLVVTSLFTFVDTYNSFFLPLVYLTSPKITRWRWASISSFSCMEHPTREPWSPTRCSSRPLSCSSS